MNCLKKQGYEINTIFKKLKRKGKEMRKIKSVKLRHDYWDEFTYVQQGTELTRAKLNYWYLNETRTINENDIISNKSKIFEIEYEPEGFEFVSFPQTVIFNNKLIINTKAISELNRLADWCDGQSEKSSNVLYTGLYINEKDELKKSSYMFTIYYGLKFNSQKSANLFITELNKPENSDYKKYFIELLQKTRL